MARSTNYSAKSWEGSIRAVALCSLAVIAGAASGAAEKALSGDANVSMPCQVFVARDGNDANPGTESQPFGSLERARDYVRTHKAGATAPIQVCLRGGVYQLSRTFTLGPGDSGTAAAPITYRSYPGEQAILSGGVQIHPNWSTYSGQIQVAEVDRWFNQLFVNGVRATRARTPNVDANFFHLAPVAPVPSGLPFPPALQTSFLYQAGSVPAGLSNSDVEIVSMERFLAPRQRVASTGAATLTVEGSIYAAYGFDYAQNDRYYVENSLAALDSPGEWYLDKSAHRLYYWPRDPDEIRNGEFIVPQLHQLVRGGSYPGNAGFDSAGVGVIPSCRHLGVYPQASDLLSFEQQSFTVASWLRFPSGTQDPFWVFSKGDPLGDDPATGADGHGYGLSTQSIANTVPVQFFVNDGTHRISANLPAVSRAAWVHIAFVVDRSAKAMHAYINGVLAGTEDISTLGSILSALPLDIGAYTNQGCSNSAVGDFRIYSIALSAAQVAGLFAGTPPSNNTLALLLPFDGDFLDYSQNQTETVVFFPPQFTTGAAGASLTRAQAADFSTPFPNDISGSADYVGFSGLTFEYADWVMPFTGYPGSNEWWTSPSAVYLHSSHATIVGNTFAHLGSDALAGMLANSLVAGNQFSDVGGGAIRIGQEAPTVAGQVTLAPFASNDTVTGNRIQDTGIVVRDSFALWVTQGENTTISQNTVANAPFIGISLSGGPGNPITSGGGNNRISLNRVGQVMQLLNDGSGIYVNGLQPGTVIDHNVIHDVLMTPAHLFPDFIWGIYLDGGSNSFLVRDNLTYRTEYGGVFLNQAIYGNANNTVTNNIFVDGVEYQLGLFYASQDSFFGNIVYDDEARPQPCSRLLPRMRSSNRTTIFSSARRSLASRLSSKHGKGSASMRTRSSPTPSLSTTRTATSRSGFRRPHSYPSAAVESAFNLSISLAFPEDEALSFERGARRDTIEAPGIG